MDAEIYPSNRKEAEEIRKKVSIAGGKLLLIKQKHLGSDHLPEYIENIGKFLKEKGVELLDRSDVIDIKTIDKNNHEITYKKGNKTEIIKSKIVVVAPGRTGAKWVQELADKYKIPYLSQSSKNSG